MAKASAKVVFSFATRNRFWFGMTISVSTDACRSAMPCSATRMRRWPSKWKGLVTTPTVRMPISRATLATIGAAPVPVPPPMPAVTKVICAPTRWSRISSITSSAAARPTSGCEPAPSPWVTTRPAWITRSAFDIKSACASVFMTTNSTPWRPLSIMLLTALPPAPPTPKTVIRGFSSRMSGALRLIVIALASSSGSPIRTPVPVTVHAPDTPACHSAGGLELFLEALLDPSPDTGEVAVAGRSQHAALTARLEMLHIGDLRIDQKADGGGESRPFRGLRQPLDPERPADPHLLRENAARGVDEAGELAAPAGEHVAAPLRRETGLLQAVAHQFQDLLDARLEDAHELSARHMGLLGSVLGFDCGHGDRLALVGAGGDRRSVERLQPLGRR